MTASSKINTSLSSIIFAFSLVISTGCWGKFSAQKNSDVQGKIVKVDGVSQITDGSETRATMTLPNGLEVLLVSNPKFTKGAAGMAVPVGSWDDPEEHQGLAHYLEHMLFLGNKENPTPDEFNNYTTGNGGYTNAYTAKQYTNYFFEVNSGALPEAMRQFAQFFISPTLDQKYAEKERNAVHSEFDKNIRNDGWRMRQMVGLTGPADHPMRKFNIGSHVTLASVDPEVLHEFYEKHYSADTMKLSVVSPLPIEELKAVVLASYSKIPNRELKKVEKPAAFPKYKPGQWVDVKAIGDLNNMSLIFPVASFGKNWQTKPDLILNALLSTEKPGSLGSYLKNQLLADKVEAYIYDMAAPESDTAFVEISIQLSKTGDQQRESVLASVFSYVGFLQKELIRDHTFNEQKALAQISLENRGAVDGGEEASRLSAGMLLYPALEINTRESLITDRNDVLVSNYLKALTPENMSVIHYFRGAVTDNKEANYGIEFKQSSIPKELKKKLRSAMKTESSVYTYAAANPWLPEVFDLLKTEKATEPYLLSGNEKGKLWFLQENGPGTKPLAYTNIQILSPEVGKSPRSYLLALLYGKAFDLTQSDRLAPYLEAGLHFGVQVNSQDFETGIRVVPTGFEFGVKGFSDKFVPFLRQLVASPAAKLNEITISAEALQKFKDDIRRDIVAYNEKDAYKRAIEHHNYFANSPNFRPEDYQDLIDSVTLEEFHAFTKQAFKRIQVTGLAYGNLSGESMRDLVDAVVANLGAEALNADEIQLAKNRENLLKPGQKISSVISDANNNNALMVRMHTPRTAVTLAKNLVLGNLLERDYYFELRTNQQLGYIVSAAHAATNDSLQVYFLIQSAKYPVDQLKARSDEFIAKFLANIDASLNEKFAASRDGLIEELSRKTQLMEERYELLEKLFKDRNAEWLYNDNAVAELRKLKPEEVKEYALSMLTPEQQARLSVYYVASGNKKPEKMGDEVLVENKNEFDSVRTNTGEK